jgi:hypothetical protein
VLDENAALWQGQRSAPGGGSVLRTRRFWRQFYRLEQEWDSDAFPETYRFSFYVPSATRSVGRLLIVSSAPDETLLHFASTNTVGDIEIGRVDEVNTEPHTFRWSEVQAIARYLDRQRASPVNPSIALLLLSAFVGGVDDDRVSLTTLLSVELERLGLLSEVEIAEVIKYRLVATYGTFKYERIWWTPDPVVGWRLDGTPPNKSYDNSHPGYSGRIPGDFPADGFLALLRDVGVDDV